jgi:DNA helicase II / ATP-dependent DNA helicase PcrA
MINQTEREEREYLEVIKEKLVLAIRRIEDRVKQLSSELRQNKEYIYEHQSGLDEADMVAADQSINRLAATGESTVGTRKKLRKLIHSPYFGRIDFIQKGDADETAAYIGIHTFSDEASGANLVYDWRAPISSMFYDFELGEAWYETPSGKITGQIVLKRQYKIQDGKMEFLIENAINIHDDVLQRELSKSADDKMKNIIATIQRDQNAIIRNEEAPVMIIQGVTGSGKTSIALHRIAFLLYRFRDTIKSKDVLIISPNKVFADYISNVLPELGEEHIPEMLMEELASEVLDNKFRFQTFLEQVSHLLEKRDQSFIDRIQFKSTYEFLGKLNKYLIYIENNFFEPVELRVGKVVVPSPFIHEKFKQYHRIPLLKRFYEVVKDIQNYVRDIVKRKLTGQEKAQIWQAAPQMVKVSNVFDLYRNFYNWIEKPELFKSGHNSTIEYADVFPLLYCMIRVEGVKTYDHVKHLLIDEMQDYTPIQYAVVSRLFKCRKTILGDISQTVNPYSASSAELIEQVFPHADTVKLFRSYRSTFEITSFAQRIVPNPNVIPMERHGDEPEILGFNTDREEADFIKRKVEKLKKLEPHHLSVGIICKTGQQAKALHEYLMTLHDRHGIYLLKDDSTSFKEGIIITTAHLAKGLEFDTVLVPSVSERNYKTDMDRRMLYIACTRAMHQLTLTYSGPKSSILSF